MIENFLKAISVFKLKFWRDLIRLILLNIMRFEMFTKNHVSADFELIYILLENERIKRYISKEKFINDNLKSEYFEKCAGMVKIINQTI